MNDRQLIADLLSALEYHTEQTRPIEFSKVAIQAAREYLRKPAQQSSAGVPPLYPEPEPGVSIKPEYEPAQSMRPEIKKMYEDYFDKCFREPSPAQQEPVAWVYPEGLEALKAGKPWTAYGTRQEPNNTALYLSPQPDIPPYALVTFTPYGDEDDVWYENPEGQLLEGWTYKPLYDTTPPQRTWVGLTDEDVQEVERWVEFKEEGSDRIQTPKLIRYIEAKLKEKNT